MSFSNIIYACVISIFLPFSALALCSAAPVGTAGDPVLQFRLNGDGIVAFGAANNVVSNEEGAVVWDDTANALAYCDGSNWVTLTGGASVDDATCPTPGDSCSDGSVYVGIEADYHIYSVAQDHFLRNSGVVSGTQMYQVCRDLSLHSQTDWQMPTRGQFKLIQDNANSILTAPPFQSFWVNEHQPGGNASNYAIYTPSSTSASNFMNIGNTYNLVCVRAVRAH